MQVRETIETLREANIKVWMLTGACFNWVVLVCDLILRSRLCAMSLDLFAVSCCWGFLFRSARVPIAARMASACSPFELLKVALIRRRRDCLGMMFCWGLDICVQATSTRRRSRFRARATSSSPPVRARVPRFAFQL